MGGLLHLVQRDGLGGARPGHLAVPTTKCNSPPINAQCANHRIAVQWSVALRFYFHQICTSRKPLYIYVKEGTDLIAFKSIYNIIFSVCLSVCMSVCMSVTLVICVKAVRRIELVLE